MHVSVAAEGVLNDNSDYLSLILPPTPATFSDPIVSNFSARSILFVVHCVSFANVVGRCGVGCGVGCGTEKCRSLWDVFLVYVVFCCGGGSRMW